jgi:antitoxin component HigA of HigAB toxin-antitoxin module
MKNRAADMIYAIRNEREYDAAVERLNALVDEIGDDPKDPRYRLIETRSVLIKAYDRDTHWSRLLMQGSSLLSLGLHERLGITLLELCSDFGIEDSHGTLLRVVFSHSDLARWLVRRGQESRNILLSWSANIWSFARDDNSL